MREIKFRAWDKTIKEMYSHDMCEINGWSPNLQYPDEARTHTDKNIVWMQYTGLKDKNGKEIYEGDIVVDDYGNRDKVIWSRADLGFELEEIITTDVGVVQIWVGLTVIGNIYENPELAE